MVKRFVVLIFVVVALVLVRTDAEAGEPSAFIRVNQVGYVVGYPKLAYLMSVVPMNGAGYTVVNNAQTVVLNGAVRKSAKWSNKFKYIYLLDFSSVSTVDTYTLQVGGVVSPPFRIDTGANLYAPLLANAAKFYKAQRDGSGVDGNVLNRQASHLNDANAVIYRTPKYVDVDGVPTLKRDLVAVGGTRDGAGGWFDAGDYLKFVQTTSFTTGLMLFAVRDSAMTANYFEDEARVGIDWLSKMWDGDTQTLYYQVGIGDGDGKDILGDHDLWRLPQFDDGIDLGTSAEWKYVKNRPLLRAGNPGALISPNLAGRMAAAFALCYQVYRVSDAPYAEECLRDATQIFELAKTQDVKKLLTVSPFDFYPEDEWRDDMEWGAVELYNALAAGTPPSGLPHDAAYYLERAAHWAQKYNERFEADYYDTLNLYDVGGLAHYELHGALGASGHGNDLAVSQKDLFDDMNARLARDNDTALKMPFLLGKTYDSGDVVPHALGLMLMAGWLHEMSPGTFYLGMGQQQLNWVLGANPWGSSFVIGAGTTFPHCPQHQIANLAGALDGTSPILLGGVVDGPGAKSEFRDLGLPEDPVLPNDCPTDGADLFKRFSGKGVRYKDDVAAWMSVEPTLDYTILSVLAFARQVGD